MIETTSFAALLLAAAAIGALHAVAPDHWLPLAAVSRTRGFSRRRTAALTVLCGLVHLTVSAALGLVALRLGTAWTVAVADRLVAVAGSLAILGGLTWAAWSLHRAMNGRWKSAGPTRIARWSVGGLLLFFALDACVALVPLTFTAASYGAVEAALVIALYGLATLGVMLSLTVPVRAGMERWRGRGFARWGDAAAGMAVAAAALIGVLLG